MIKDVLQKSYEQHLRGELVAPWCRYINEQGTKNPQDVLPEMRPVLTDTQACPGDLESVGC
jgi:hypothetical protein